jgi:hypothetical protein
MQFSSKRALGALGMVLVVSAVMVSSAVAATMPEFKPVPAKKKFTGSGGEVAFHWASGEYITCGKSSESGEIIGARTVGKTILKLNECSLPSCTKKAVRAVSQQRTNCSLVLTVRKL